MSERKGSGSESNASRARTGRPSLLSPTEVVDGAIGLADELGLDDLSMPKLARHLGVGTMTLYGYVDSKDDLLDQMAGHILEGLRAPSDPDWRRGLSSFFNEFREAALAHPTLASLLATGRITIPAVFDILEGHLAAATEDGETVEDALRVFYAGLTYSIGFVIWETPRTQLQTEVEYAAQWAELLGQLDPDAYPLLTGPGTDVAPTVASTQQFTWGLQRIIRG